MAALECENWHNFQRGGAVEATLSLLANRFEPLRIGTTDKEYAWLCARTVVQYGYEVGVIERGTEYTVFIQPG